MRTIDLSKVRDSLPEGATVELKHKKGEGAFFDVVLVQPLNPLFAEEAQDKLVDAIGDKNINVFLTHESGLSWLVFLVRKTIQFVNPSKTDVAEDTLTKSIITPN